MNPTMSLQTPAASSKVESEAGRQKQRLTRYEAPKGPLIRDIYGCACAGDRT